MHTVTEYSLRFRSNPFLTAIGVTMTLETVIEGGETQTWLLLTMVAGLCYGVANHVHTGHDDMVADIHDSLDTEYESCERCN